MKKSVQRNPKQLRLTGETLRQLTTIQLPLVAGGDVTTTVKDYSKVVTDCEDFFG